MQVSNVSMEVLVPASVPAAAEKLMAQSSALRYTLNLPSELQMALESAIIAEQRKYPEEEPTARHSDATFHNDEVPNSTVIIQSTS